MRVETTCPFCNKLCTFDTAALVPYVSHAVPYCREFAEAEDALAFIVKVNEKLRESTC